MDSNRPKPQKSAPNPAAKNRPASPQPRAAARSAAKPTSKPAAMPAPKNRTGLYLAIAAAGVLAIGIGTGAAVALMGRSSQDAKPTEVAAKSPKAKADPKAMPPSEKPRGLPGVVNGAYVIRQENGPEVNPVDEPGPGFRVEDDGEKPAAAVMKIDVSLTDIPKVPKNDPKPEPKENKESMPWVTFAHGPNTFGISTTKHAPASAANKKLTFAPNGGTSNTVFRINGVPHVPDNMAKAKLEIRTSPDGIPIASEKVWTVGGIEITELLDVVSGNPVDTSEGSRRFLDTLQVRYRLVNKTKGPQRAGVRALIDTLIGNNDGVPFTVSGKSGLISTQSEFKAPNIPFFLQALEKFDLKDPGTVAHITCKPSGIESPDRVMLTNWVPSTNWDIPLAPFSSDSAVVFYWADKAIPAGGSREIGFDYGLAAISSKEGSLGIGFAGNFEVKQQFTVTAYIQRPVGKQTATLELPRGLELAGGAMTQPVVFAGKDAATVTWRVSILEPGDFRVKVVTSNGLEQTKPLKVDGPAVVAAPPDVMAGIGMDVMGPFELGKPFVLRASIVPKAGDSILLMVPPLLQVVKAEPIGQFVLGSAVMAEWKVQANTPFDAMPIKVVLKSGASVERRLSIKAIKSEVPITDVAITSGTKENTYTVTATVEGAKPEQKLTLQLPPELKRIDGDETILVKAPADETKPAIVQWTIEADKNGSYPVAVESSIGPAAKKLLIVDKKAKTPAGTFTLLFEGDIQPGKICTLVADVPDPAPGQKLTLELPKGLSLTDGDPTREVPAIEFKFQNVTSKVRWQVRPAAVGTFSARVASSTDVARTRVLIIGEK